MDGGSWRPQTTPFPMGQKRDGTFGSVLDVLMCELLDGSIQRKDKNQKHGTARIAALAWTERGITIRLIDADALEESGWWLIRDNRNQSIAQTYETKAIDAVTTIDAVPVVRCRECLYWGNRWTGCPKLHGLETPDNFFCKYGKPKD